MTPLPRSASSLPASNCGFTRSTSSAPGRASESSGSATVRNEMKDRSATTSVEAAAEVVAAQAAQVGPFPHGDAGIGAQALVELVAAHVERHHVRRAALEQAVGEAAGGRAGVEHPEPGDVDAEVVEGGVELLAAARHEPGARPDELDRLSGRDEAGRLVGRGAAHQDPPCCDGGARLLAAVDQAPADQLGVEATPGGRGTYLPAVFLAGAFLATAFLAGAFLAAAFFATAFLAGAFLARRPSWPRSSWREPSWPAPSWRRAWASASRCASRAGRAPSWRPGRGSRPGRAPRGGPARGTSRWSGGCGRAGPGRPAGPARPGPRRS